MSTILTGIIIICLSGAFALHWKRKIEELFGFSILIIVLILYISGIIGYLNVGRYIVIGTTIISACYCLGYFIRNNRKDWLLYLCTPGLLVFIILLLYCFFNFRNRLADSYDDFSHWALEIKNMYSFGAIPNGIKETTVYFTSYPPASSLFAYFWIELAGVLNEGDMFRSMMVFSLSMLFPVFSRITWQKWKLIIPLAITCFVLPLIFNGDSYCTLLVDCLLGTVAVYPVYFCYVSENRKGLYFISGVALFVLPLIKVSGFALSILISFVLATAILIKNHDKSLFSRFAFILSLLLCSVAGKLSWDWYLKVNNPMALQTTSSLGRFMQLITNGVQSYQNSGIEAYLGKMISPESWNNYSKQPFLFWLVIFVVLTLIFTSKNMSYYKNISYCKIKKDRIVLLSMASCGVLYAISLLLTYFVFFSESEASTVTACERYLSTMLITMFSTMLFVLFDKLLSSSDSGFRSALLLMLVILLIVDPLRLYVNTVGQFKLKNGAAISRVSKKPSDRILGVLNSQSDNVYFVTQEDNAYPYWVNRFDFTPVHIYDGQDIHLKGEEKNTDVTAYDRFLTIKEWENELQKGGYTHLYIYGVNQEFIDDFGCMFENPDDIQAKTLYFIEYNGDTVHFKFDMR